MTTDVSQSLGGLLCLLAALSAVAVAVVGPMVGAGVATSMLGLVGLAMLSPVGPQVRWEPPLPGNLQ